MSYTANTNTIMNMNSSDVVGNKNTASVFSVSNEAELNSSFSFNTPSIPHRWGSLEPVVGRSSSIQKPRLQKIKKHTTSQPHNPSRSMPDRGGRTGDSGFNPFGPILASADLVSSYGSERSAPEFVSGVPGSDSISTADLNLGQKLIDEMKRLRILNTQDGVSTSKTDTVWDYKFNVNDKTNLSSGSGDNVDKSFEMDLPNEFQRLNLTSSSVLGSDKYNFKQGKFIFDSRQEGTDSVPQSSGDILSNKLRNLRVTPNSNDDGQAERLSAAMEKMKIRSEIGDFPGERNTETSSSQQFGKGTQTANLGDVNFADPGKSIPEGDKNCSQVPIGQPNNVTKSNGGANSTGVHFQSVINVFGKQDGLGTPTTEYKTPSVKTFGSDHPLEFSAEIKSSKNVRTKKRRGKRQSGIAFVPMENNSQPNLNSTISYSPMDVSPYQETLAERQSSREASVTSEGSLHFCNDDASIDACPLVSDNAIDEDLVAAARRLVIDDAVESTYSETNGKSSEYRSANDALNQSFSGAECESFITANEQLDTDSDTASTSADADSGCSSKSKRQISDGREHFSFASTSQDSCRSNFTFAASTSIQGQLPAATRQQHKKKNWKVGYGLYNSASDASDPYASSSNQFISLSRASSFLSRSNSLKTDKAASQCKGEMNSVVNEKQYIMQDSVSVSAASQEACEKWRLRGNHAYASGDFSKAEDSYTQGLSCISQNETSKASLRALMLCYSNRAATRMSLGRVREALGDCILAAAIDPNFLRVQLRAAQCCLALGEVEEATGYFKKILHLGSDVCVDRKIAIEASEGLQKAEKLSYCIIHSAELLQHGTSDDAQTALGIIADALSVSFHSEELLEMKAKAFFMLQKYEEVIQLCKQTLDSAEKNSLMMNENSASTGSLEVPRYSSFRLWRLGISFKSYFYLGRLEEALDMVEKQERAGNESKALESAIPFIVTVRELLHHKALGNEAFQSGRPTEAIEHYSAALSCNVESRPFAAICFCNRAAAYKALGQITDAIADCSLAMALDGNYLKAISRRATLFEMIRDYDQAANDLHRLLSLLANQEEAKVNHSGASEKFARSGYDLRQIELHLSTIEEEARKDIPLDMYLILGIEPSTSAAEIRKAYHKAALKHHPDKAGQYLSRGESRDDGVWKKIAEEAYGDADRLFKMIGEAYTMLSDPTKRSQYDLEEEVRNALSKGGSGIKSQRNHADGPSYPFDKSSSRRHWQEIRKSFRDAHSRGPEASRSGRFY